MKENKKVTRDVIYYNLDAIIAIGYGVNFTEATKFRIWTTNTSHKLAIAKADEE